MFRLAAASIMFVSTVLEAGSVLAQQRLPTIPPDQYTADQKKAAEEFLATRKVPASASE
jgi:4-carboxymuconolactone decarboxylase